MLHLCRKLPSRQLTRRLWCDINSRRRKVPYPATSGIIHCGESSSVVRNFLHNVIDIFGSDTTKGGRVKDLATILAELRALQPELKKRYPIKQMGCSAVGCAASSGKTATSTCS
jgi:hypothetical protein